MIPKKDKIDVKLLGEDGNAFYILGKVSKELRRNGFTKEQEKEYYNEATSGDYSHLLNVTGEWVNII